MSFSTKLKKNHSYITKVYTLDIQECTLLSYKNVHFCMVIMYILAYLLSKRVSQVLFVLFHHADSAVFVMI